MAERRSVKLDKKSKKTMEGMTLEEKIKVQEILNDTVSWAQTFVKVFNKETGEQDPWIGRWYQVEMLRDKSFKKVYRCGRRIGKTETMIMEGLKLTFTNKHFRVLFVTPYESQVKLIFDRIVEILDESPALKQEVVRSTKNPYELKIRNGSSILGFTTGASSGSGGASVRGQKADYIFMDEVDYMTAADFDTITTIAAERTDIGICMSSTPTGQRSKFYEACTNPNFGYNQHYHPSTHNPGWNKEMEASFKAQLSEQGYVHEVLAEFGTEEMGVFNKDCLDKAVAHDLYTYSELTYYQELACKCSDKKITKLIYDANNPAPPNPFRTMGVDWDKYGASSSILILDYDIVFRKFRVFKRYELPASKYSYDNAVNTIVELNDIYNPSYIYCDRGSGEYQIERLHILGDKNPKSGLDKKVYGKSFKETFVVEDPITGEKTNNMFKHVMINQLQMCIERDRLILSPFDDVLNKQLIDYEVVKNTPSGPVYTNKNEHFIDALGLAYMAFVDKFPKIARGIDEIEYSSKAAIIKSRSSVVLNRAIRSGAISITGIVGGDSAYNTSIGAYKETRDMSDGPDGQRYNILSKKQINQLLSSNKNSNRTWGSRSGGSCGRRNF